MISPSLSKAGAAGFGLVQVLFIVAALAISASVILMSNPAAQRSAGPDLSYRRMDAVKDAVARYRADGNGTPANLAALSAAPTGAITCAPDTNPASATFRKLRGWCGPYLLRDTMGSDLPNRDGWNTLLQYNGTTLTSCGPNRVCGDGDDITATL